MSHGANTSPGGQMSAGKVLFTWHKYFFEKGIRRIPVKHTRSKRMITRLSMIF
ncbi:hypothetical protein Gotur_021400 [Gossypium turneri]